MDKKRSTYTSSAPKAQAKNKAKDPPKKAKGDCADSASSSHTQIFRRKMFEDTYTRITTDEYLGIPESISGSSDTYQCVHGPEGKQYTEKTKLRRNLIKELDPIPTDSKWGEGCPLYGWELAAILEFLVKDPVGHQNTERLEAHLRDFAVLARFGYKIEVLNSLTTVLDYLVENLKKKPSLKELLVLLLRNMNKPILLTVASDVITQLEAVRNYIGFLGYLLLRVEEDDLFKLVSRGILWQLSATDEARGSGTLRRRHVLTTGGTHLLITTVRMLALATPERFPTFQQIALLLACHSTNFCIELMRENIIESILYRFNPYFPMKDLPDYEETPLDPQDFNVKLGSSSIYMSTTLSLLLILLKTLRSFFDENPAVARKFPCPDYYSQRCFLWAYRYECRARGRRHERLTLTVIAHALLSCFGDRLEAFCSLLMPDIMSLSVLTEVPPKQIWIQSVGFNTSQLDVQFKKILIYFSVDLLKTFPCNRFMVESQYWLLGLMFLLDPNLCDLRARWSPALFVDISKSALQALVCTIHLMPSKLVAEYDIIRRIMWYIEWYSENPYELPVLYWCVRLLHAAIRSRSEPTRADSLCDLFDTHGIIILMHLCYTLLEQRCPPVEKSQVVLALTVRLLTSAVEADRQLACCVYPQLQWPASVNTLATKMLDIALYSLDKHLLLSDRWLISILNFIWEAIIWRKEYREKFVMRNGVYNLLDMITMSKPCDLARSGVAVAQLVTWCAGLGASNANPCVVKRGATIASLLAAMFRDDCLASGVRLDHRGVVQDLDCPLMSTEVRNELKSPDFCEAPRGRPYLCLAVADMAGSRMSKAFALLHILSEDLQHKVSIADEAYNLYKNIQLALDEETILVLCSHYLTLKLNETWAEAEVQCFDLLKQDKEVLEEFLQINGGWAKEVKRQQEEMLKKHSQRDVCEEKSLYALLAKVRLNNALDALREVRCVARSGTSRSHDLPHQAPQRVAFPHTLIPTYEPPLDDLNLTGQYVKVRSIPHRSKSKSTIDAKSPN
ncbi:uncharacterized protein LOC123880455 [Maniola jurtina]|uniref:uncharacterized protein LOC123880455 n=1 Tax=Maniola jurtina TaxID=191418 RepID=UPI001E6871F8|nr:uncharacterized protein LOC123880455 [Maniola jurtina]